jgi:hypothetical protein
MKTLVRSFVFLNMLYLVCYYRHGGQQDRHGGVCVLFIHGLVQFLGSLSADRSIFFSPFEASSNW